MNKAMTGAALAALILTLTACGGSTTTVQSTETQGQQLIDLQEAYDKGVINEKEYKKAKQRILNQ